MNRIEKNRKIHTNPNKNINNDDINNEANNHEIINTDTNMLKSNENE